MASFAGNSGCNDRFVNCFINSNITLNSTQHAGHAAAGGGVYSEGTGLTNAGIEMKNVVLYGNYSFGSGGGFYGLRSDATLTNCTVYSNTGVHNSGGYFNAEINTSTITNCIFWNNVGALTPSGGHFNYGIAYSHTAPTVTYSSLQGTGSGTGNIVGDPLFFNAGSLAGTDGVLFTSDDGLRLIGTSPALNTGTTTSATKDIRGVGRPIGAAYDMGAYEGSANKS